MKKKRPTKKEKERQIHRFLEALFAVPDQVSFNAIIRGPEFQQYVREAIREIVGGEKKESTELQAWLAEQTHALEVGEKIKRLKELIVEYAEKETPIPPPLDI